MKLLMHTCCAPCSVMCIETLRCEDIEPVLYFFNPNIHPLKEFKMRKNTLVEYSKSVGAKLILENGYGLREFIKGVYPDFDNRCAYCYRTRLETTAKFAADNGYDAFTSTLFISPYQNHELMKEIAGQAALSFCTAISDRISRKVRKRRAKPDFICRSTAAAYSARRTAIKSTKGKRLRRNRSRCK